ncbi:MAG: hypothetical protein AAFP90_05570, partial [Planctomycetota bacterium]
SSQARFTHFFPLVPTPAARANVAFTNVDAYSVESSPLFHVSKAHSLHDANRILRPGGNACSSFKSGGNSIPAVESRSGPDRPV